MVLMMIRLLLLLLLVMGLVKQDQYKDPISVDIGTDYAVSNGFNDNAIKKEG
ncbi:hypothetical protein [Borreliella americana]|uniref:hypothetical protein n=1 Tax=Borreliella americana TaxID=478807 RepID=UPI001E28F9BC|nr:hypothetical protein [Borreliella americana]MCD2332630.1 hypothetical protein [Borreliella americana]